MKQSGVALSEVLDILTYGKHIPKDSGTWIAHSQEPRREAGYEYALTVVSAKERRVIITQFWAQPQANASSEMPTREGKDEPGRDERKTTKQKGANIQ